VNSPVGVVAAKQSLLNLIVERSVLLYVELVARWVREEDETEDESRLAQPLPALAVLTASLALVALPPAVGVLLLLGLLG
jgi:hypothetical protein